MKSKVKFDDNSVVTVEGVGKVMVKRKDEVKTCITNVLYVRKLKNNLLSLGQLAEKGYSMSLEQNAMRVNDVNRKLILKFLCQRIGLSSTWERVHCCHLEWSALVVALQIWTPEFQKFEPTTKQENGTRSSTNNGTTQQICENCYVSKRTGNAFKSKAPPILRDKLEVIYSYVCVEPLRSSLLEVTITLYLPLMNIQWWCGFTC